MKQLCIRPVKKAIPIIKNNLGLLYYDTKNPNTYFAISFNPADSR